MPSCEWAAGGCGRRRLCTKVTDFYAERASERAAVACRWLPRGAGNRRKKAPIKTSDISSVFSRVVIFEREGRASQPVSHSVVLIRPAKRAEAITLYERAGEPQRPSRSLLANMKRESLSVTSLDAQKRHTGSFSFKSNGYLTISGILRSKITREGERDPPKIVAVIVK